jgi:hypothetical protein
VRVRGRLDAGCGGPLVALTLWPRRRSSPWEAAGAPSVVLDAEPGDQVAPLVGYRWSSWRSGLSPVLLDQMLVPGEQGARGDDPVAAQDRRRRPGQGYEQGAVGPSRLRGVDLPAQRCDLVPKDQNLDVLGGGGSAQ